MSPPLSQLDAVEIRRGLEALAQAVGEVAHVVSAQVYKWSIIQAKPNTSIAYDPERDDHLRHLTVCHDLLSEVQKTARADIARAMVAIDRKRADP